MDPNVLLGGLSAGSLYALVAVGFTLVFGVLGVINFAHGEFYMLGAFAVYEGMQAKSKYSDAKNLLQSDGAVQQSASVSQYQSLVSDGDSAKSRAYIGGGAAVGCAVAAGVLGYLSYKQTGEIGPFRF